MEISEKMKVYLDSEMGKAAMKLVAYTINATKTVKDDEIIDNVDDVIGVVAEAINNIANVEVSTDEAKAAAMAIIKAIALATPGKWDDRVVPIIDLFL